MSTGSWTTEVTLDLVALIAFYVQLFFCRRLWVTLHFDRVWTHLSRGLARLARVEIHLATVFAGDVLLCGSTIYFLLFHSKHSSPETAGMLNSITKLTFQSAAPAAVCALISLVGTVAWDRKTPNAYVMLATIANNVLPKLYAISAMWTLNSRRRIHQAHSSTGRNSTVPVTEPRHPNDIELSSPRVSSERSTPIHVQTEVETARYTEQVFSQKYDRPYQ
ncbi:hypothetical protein B0H13DRAFT_2378322 [Mycena leptocephala]|nr:hypothetical protein B0H13DRAFT_2378322 [Mycena leptocephala]